MAMEISSAMSAYGNYQSSYDSNKTNEKKETQVEDEQAVKMNSTNASKPRKTATDELAYLSKKFDGYSFTAANYTKGMRYGSSSTTNVAISPQFLSKMASNPELESEYVKEIENMQKLDEDFIKGQAARGWKVVDQGWAIDKDGGISSWAITTKDPNAKSLLQKMGEKSDEIRQKQLEKKKAEKNKNQEQKTIIVTGKNSKEVASRMMSAIQGNTGVSSLDIKA